MRDEDKGRWEGEMVERGEGERKRGEWVRKRGAGEGWGRVWGWVN